MDMQLIEELPKGVTPGQCLICRARKLPFIQIIRTIAHSKIYSAICCDCSKDVTRAIQSMAVGQAMVAIPKKGQLSD